MNSQLNSRVNSQHPLYKCDHEENRTKVCALCGKKIIFQNKPSHHFLLSEKHIEVIKKHINGEFNIYNSKFPKSLCSSCRLTINEYGNDIFKRPCPTMPNYEDLKLSKETRTMGCNCYICLTARVTSHKKQKKGRGQIRDFSTNIDVNKCFDDTSQQKDLLSKNEAKATKPRTSTELCNSCFQQIGKGISHSCRGPSTSNARKNVLNIVQKLPEKQQNQIITKILKKKYPTMITKIKMSSC